MMTKPYCTIIILKNKDGSVELETEDTPINKRYIRVLEDGLQLYYKVDFKSNLFDYDQAYEGTLAIYIEIDFEDKEEKK